MASNYRSNYVRRAVLAGAAIVATAIPAVGIAATTVTDDGAANGLRKGTVVQTEQPAKAARANGL